MHPLSAGPPIVRSLHVLKMLHLSAVFFCDKSFLVQKVHPFPAVPPIVRSQHAQRVHHSPAVFPIVGWLHVQEKDTSFLCWAPHASHAQKMHPISAVSPTVRLLPAQKMRFFAAPPLSEVCSEDALFGCCVPQCWVVACSEDAAFPCCACHCWIIASTEGASSFLCAPNCRIFFLCVFKRCIACMLCCLLLDYCTGAQAGTSMQHFFLFSSCAWRESRFFERQAQCASCDHHRWMVACSENTLFVYGVYHC